VSEIRGAELRRRSGTNGSSGESSGWSPTGNQIEIGFEDQRAVLVEVGGGIRTYDVRGQAIIDGYGSNETCESGRGQVLIPWPNRLQDGLYTFEGQQYQLPLTEPTRQNAIHGLVRWSNWETLEVEQSTAVVGLTLYPQSGWPFALDLTIRYTLGPNGLDVCTTAVNIGAQSAPYGTGAHPYLTVGASLIDELYLDSPANRWSPTDDRGIPTHTERVDDSPYDFRKARKIGSIELDTAFSDLSRDGSGVATVELTDPSSGDSVRLWMDGSYDHLMLFSGDTLPIARRRRGLAIEPMTCAPNALRSGEGLVTLTPGESHTARWGVRASVAR
jgi:aldose 1-epimerase